jgi:hypothetical protein
LVPLQVGVVVCEVSVAVTVLPQLSVAVGATGTTLASAGQATVDEPAAGTVNTGAEIV